MRLEIHFESLRVEGVDGLTREELSAQIERELQRLIEVWGVPPALREGGAIRFGEQSIRLPSGVAREAVGAEVTRQLVGSWFA